MISIGIGALCFAIWLIVLFFGKSIGLSMLLFAIPFSCFIIHILQKSNKIQNPKFKFFLIPILLLSSTYFIFDNAFFNVINIFVIPILYSFMILGLIGQNINNKSDTICSMFYIFIKSFECMGTAIESFIKAINEKLKIDTKSKNNEKKNDVERIIIGSLITIPIILIIIILLATADEIFAGIFQDVVDIIDIFLSNIDIQNIYIKIYLTLIAFIYFIGLFYYISVKCQVVDTKKNLKTKINDNFAIKMILVSLNIIYLIFCYIQIKSLFLKDTTLNYADYARQGFFQLMIVSILNLVTILIAKKRQNKDEDKENSFINCMSIIMIIFTFIIVISAWVRMYFYESAYGYTLLRLLVYCILFTESILFIPTILHILGKKVNLSMSYFTIIIISYICMNFANFDNIIATRNVNRYIETGKIDLDYLQYATGADSIKQISRILEISTDDDNIKQIAEDILKEKYKKLDEKEMDFRDFNISKIVAKKVIEKNG